MTSTTSTYAARRPGRAAYVRLAVLALLLSGSFVVLTAPACWACSCAVSDVRQQVDMADEVFVGKVTRVAQTDVGQSNALARYTVAVTRTYKGSVGSSASVASAVSGVSCGLEGVEAGRSYVFFTQNGGDGLEANLCGGTAQVTGERAPQVEAVTGAGTAMTARPAVPAAPAPTHAAAPQSSVPATALAVLAVLGGLALGAIVLGIVRWRRSRRRTVPLSADK